MPCLDVQTIQNRLNEIASLDCDFERQHILEKKLWEDVLFTIAAGTDNAQQLAFEALRSAQIPFIRAFS